MRSKILTLFFIFTLIVQSYTSALEKVTSTSNEYTVIRELGQGAFGKVYEVEDLEGTHYALKTYISEIGTQDPLSVYDDFLREYSRGLALNHPHIVKAYDLVEYTEEEQLLHGVILEYIEGTTVKAITKKSLYPEESLNAALEVVEALKYALSQGYFHLDLHAANVMMDNTQGIKIIDVASFFTREEIVNFFYKITEEELENSEETPPAENTPVEQESVREMKMKQFFKNNMKVFRQIKQQIENTQAYGANASAKLAQPSIDLTPVMSYYFNRIVEICRKIISKSELDREIKVELYSELVKLSFEYEEDVEEELQTPPDFYLDKLSELIQEQNSYSYAS